MDFKKFQKINDDQVNVGVLDNATVTTTFKNEACGDDYVVYLQVDDGVIIDASFTTSGCGFSLAALSLCIELTKGKTLEDAEKISIDDIAVGVDGFPPRRLQYPQTAIEVLHHAIAKARDQGE